MRRVAGFEVDLSFGSIGYRMMLLNARRSLNRSETTNERCSAVRISGPQAPCCVVKRLNHTLLISGRPLQNLCLASTNLSGRIDSPFLLLSYGSLPH